MEPVHVLTEADNQCITLILLFFALQASGKNTCNKTRQSYSTEHVHLLCLSFTRINQFCMYRYEGPKASKCSTVLLTAHTSADISY